MPITHACKSSPTIQERVDLGAETKWPPEGAIPPFPDDLSADQFVNYFSGATGKLYYGLLNQGFTRSRFDFYHDEVGRRIAAALRFDGPDGKKQVLPLRAPKLVPGAPCFELKAIAPPRPIYNLHLLAGAPAAPVIVVEGEKAAEAGSALFPDHVLTTWSGGTPGVDKADWRALASRDVTVWPDNDEPGLKAAEKLGQLLQDVGVASLRVVQVPAYFPRKWDIADPVPVLAHE